MVIALHSSIHDRGVTLLSDAFLGNLMIHPIRVTPHGIINLAKFHGRTGIVLDGRLERFVEIAVVQEDIRVIKPPVKVSFNGLDRLDDTIQLLIPGKDDEGSIGPRTICFDWKAACGEHLVVLFIYPPANEKHRFVSH